MTDWPPISKAERRFLDAESHRFEEERERFLSRAEQRAWNDMSEETAFEDTSWDDLRADLLDD